MAIRGTTAKMLADYLVVHGMDSGRPISNLQLQKILYVCQHDAILSMGEPLFDDDFYVWCYGPVIPDVYRRWSLYGGGEIHIYSYGYDRVKQSADELDSDVAHRADVIAQAMSGLWPRTLNEIINGDGSVWKYLSEKTGDNDDRNQILPKSLIALDRFTLQDFEDAKNAKRKIDIH